MLPFLCPKIKLKTSFHLILGHKKTALSAVFQYFAEREGFEPTVPCGTMVFKTIAIDHSATSPYIFTSAKVRGFFIISKGIQIKKIKNILIKSLENIRFYELDFRILSAVVVDRNKVGIRDKYISTNLKVKFT